MTWRQAKKQASWPGENPWEEVLMQGFQTQPPAQREGGGVWGACSLPRGDNKAYLLGCYEA